MQPSDFLGLNVVFIGSAILVVFVYLVVLINKRRKQKFLHKKIEPRR